MFNVDLYDDHDLKLCEEFAVDTEAGEILTEFATVRRFPKYNMSVAINPDKNRILKDMQYFKLYNHIYTNEATKIARIKFRSCGYVIHGNNGKKKNWFLDRSEIKNLTEILNFQSEKDKGYTVWESLVINFNYESGLEFDKIKKNKSDT
ncbi:MAG: hypothetical protein K2I80_11520 [Ruminococcus sp.]|nr:hypothetical protein [Ruminococcus sp.]MDE6848256.1 hypothetical protein [Ruminococcus sp.]